MKKDVLKVVNYLIKNKLTISFAESMTLGNLVASLSNYEGISNILSNSYVTYSNEAKIKLLKVKPTTISKYSVVSHQVCEEMLTGLKELTNTNVGVVVTGMANLADNDNELKAYIGVYINGNRYIYQLDFKINNRIKNIENTIDFTYKKLVELLNL